MAGARISVVGVLGPDGVAAVTSLVAAATEADGVRPLSEHVMLHLRYGGDAPVRNVLLHEGSALAGYAHLDVTDVVEGASAELVIHPSYRHRGYARLLTARLLAESPDGRLRLWAHGALPAAAHLAKAMGFEEVRALWQLRRSLSGRIPDLPLPRGVRLRTFVPGADDEAWLALNNRAFAAHPEQGKWTLADLHRRMAESWFDPRGFFLAERDVDDGPRLIGFHWTKVHGGGDSASGHGHEPIGEVYVVGVDPAEGSHGLGAALTVAGLQHLRRLGLSQVLLYVDSDNIPAVRMYERLGFAHWETDVMFRTVPPNPVDAGRSGQPPD